MSGQPPIHATHVDAVVAAELRRAQEDSILRRERARDAQRAASARPAQAPPAQPKPPAPPRPKPPTPRRAVQPPSPPPVSELPPGHVAVPADVLDALLATHPATRKDAR